MHFAGEGMVKSIELAIACFDKAVKQGHGGAQCLLGHIHSEGIGVAKDLKQAFEYFNQAAQQGVVEAQRALGKMYGAGMHVEQDGRKSAEWLIRAAGWGKPDVGTLSLRNRGIDDTLLASMMTRLPADAEIGHLDLGNNLIGNEGAAKLAAMLDRYPTLTALNLDNNPITKPGIRALAQTLRGNATVTELSVIPSTLPGAAGNAELELIEAECENNLRIAELLQEQRSWKTDGWKGYKPELASLLEQSLIRTDIKLHDSDSKDTQRRVLEMQLCLSGLSNQ